MSMVFRWFLYKSKADEVIQEFEDLPKVTVQIPLYNERMVAKRIIDAVADLDYPRDALQIQIVDDSTDETTGIAASSVRYYQEQGLNISHVTRVNRQGFKAGALKEAMESATGEFIAVFDADFIPDPRLLKDTIHHFTLSDVGMLQFRWGHLNRQSSKLTEAQGIMLDAHFSLEQQVRSKSGMLLNFNGTAGIWRTEAIIDAGHWSADTLTEDLDLSYRAQLKGWRMLYLNDVVCAGEIPSDINAFKSQQHRWAKGGVQVMKKMLGKVWRAPLKLKVKIESTFHLSNNLAYLVILADTIVFLLPSIWIREVYQLKSLSMLDIPLLVLSSGGHLVYLVFGQVALKRSLFDAILNVPRLIAMGIQLALNNANAAIEALRGQESEFVRTPKSGELSDEEDEISNIKQAIGKTCETAHALSLYRAVPPKGALIELVLTIVYVIVFFWAFHQKMWVLLPFILFLICGAAAATRQSFVGYLKLSK
ncbi:MAG: glycosyltransferase [Symploca sp. SIO2D2]|nr:glycosyltransferase [Symploca sp. SIO2D2]